MAAVRVWAKTSYGRTTKCLHIISEVAKPRSRNFPGTLPIFERVTRLRSSRLVCYVDEKENIVRETHDQIQSLRSGSGDRKRHKESLRVTCTLRALLLFATLRHIKHRPYPSYTTQHDIFQYRSTNAAAVVGLLILREETRLD